MALVVVLAACGSSSPSRSTVPASTSDFARQAERFIDGSADVVEKLGTHFHGANCEEPPTVAVGNSYNCTSTADDGAEWDFRAEITSSGAFSIVSISPAPTTT